MPNMMMMEVVSISEKFVTFYKTTRCKIPDDGFLQLLFGFVLTVDRFGTTLHY
jgi:hypothetical protein